MKKQKFSGDMLNRVQFKFSSLSVNESMARSAVSVVCSQLDPGATELADIKCAVSEAVTNCIVHAYKGTIGLIYITVTLYRGFVKIDIRDRGCGIEDVKEARKPLFTTDKAGERSGMGFTVMESFCDKVTVSSRVGKGTHITLYKSVGNTYILP